MHGLWAQDYRSILATIKGLGYNVIRIPFSNEMVETNPVPTNFTTNAGGKAVNAALVGKTAVEDGKANLIGVAGNPVVLNVPDQLVYSAHDYGPSLFQQSWFNGAATPDSLNAVWNK